MLSSALAGLLWPLDGCGGKAVEHQTLNQSVDEPALSGGAKNNGTAATGGSGNGGAAAGASAGRSSMAGATSGDAIAGEAGGPGDGGGGTHSAGAATGGAPDGGQPTSDAGAAGSPSDGGAAGTSEVGGSGGNGGSGLAGAGGSRSCASVTECPRPANACVSARCSAGECVTDNVPAGELYVLDIPADCHATTACDGFGQATLVIDQSNTPTVPNPCLVGTCNDAGVASTEPVPMGKRCSWDFGRGRCDGAGKCVTCLTSADCPLGQSCDAHHGCVGQACSDTHCGGACPACLGDACAVDHDCASHLCDPNTLHCILDPQCADEAQNGNETDADCGGGTCPLCAAGKACLFDTDCRSFGCDTDTSLCADDACLDNHQDADESDVDCGGTNANCRRCGPGEGCYSNWDCVGGHFCNGIRKCQ